MDHFRSVFQVKPMLLKFYQITIIEVHLLLQLIAKSFLSTANWFTLDNIALYQESVFSCSEHIMSFSKDLRIQNIMGSPFQQVKHFVTDLAIQEFVSKLAQSAKDQFRHLSVTLDQYQDTAFILVLTLGLPIFILAVFQLSTTRMGRWVFIILVESVLCATNSFKYIAAVYIRPYLPGRIREMDVDSSISLEMILKVSMFAAILSILTCMRASAKIAKERAVEIEDVNECFEINQQAWYAYPSAEEQQHETLEIFVLVIEAEINHELRNKARRFHRVFNG